MPPRRSFARSSPFASMPRGPVPGCPRCDQDAHDALAAHNEHTPAGYERETVILGNNRFHLAEDH